MRVVQSDSPEVARCIESAGARASRYLPVIPEDLSPGLILLLLTLAAGVTISARAALQFGGPALFVWSLYLLWLKRSPRRNWCVAACAGRIFIRLDAGKRDVILLDASEIASISIHAFEVYLYGPKPRIAEQLVIVPARAGGEHILDAGPFRPMDCETEGCCGAPDPGELVRVSPQDGSLLVAWRWCRPELRALLRRVQRECPSVAIASEEVSELDLNGIWHGFREWQNGQREMLAQAGRLGFRRDCAWLLHIYRVMPMAEVRAFLAEIDDEDAVRGRDPKGDCGSFDSFVR
jgi:hypothetical protein